MPKNFRTTPATTRKPVSKICSIATDRAIRKASASYGYGPEEALKQDLKTFGAKALLGMLPKPALEYVLAYVQALSNKGKP